MILEIIIIIKIYKQDYSTTANILTWLICLTEGELEGDLLAAEGNVVGEYTTSLGIAEAEASEFNSHVDDIARTEHEGAEVRGVVILR